MPNMNNAAKPNPAPSSSQQDPLSLLAGAADSQRSGEESKEGGEDAALAAALEEQRRLVSMRTAMMMQGIEGNGNVYGRAPAGFPEAVGSHSGGIGLGGPPLSSAAALGGFPRPGLSAAGLFGGHGAGLDQLTNSELEFLRERQLLAQELQRQRQLALLGDPEMQQILAARQRMLLQQQHAEMMGIFGGLGAPMEAALERQGLAENARILQLMEEEERRKRMEIMATAMREEKRVEEQMKAQQEASAAASPTAKIGKDVESRLETTGGQMVPTGVVGDIRREEVEKKPNTIILPCRARGMPMDHNVKTAYFVVSDNVKHGEELLCSYFACRNAGTKFRYCIHCKIPVAKRNFGKRHKHAGRLSLGQQPQPEVASDGDSSTESESVKPPATAVPESPKEDFKNLALTKTLLADVRPGLLAPDSRPMSDIGPVGTADEEIQAEWDRLLTSKERSNGNYKDLCKWVEQVLECSNKLLDGDNKRKATEMNGSAKRAKSG